MILIFIIVEIIIITYEIWRTRKAREATIAKAYRSMNLNLAIGVVWSVLFSLFMYFFVDGLRRILYLYDGEHIKNIFQLFDYNYLISLGNYFTEKQMFFKAIDIIFYRNTFFRTITGVIISSSNAFVFLYRGLQRQRICDNLMMTQNGNYKWDKVLEYSLSEEIKNGKLNYFNLNIKVKRNKLDARILNDETLEVELRFNIDHKEKVDKFLIETISKT